MKLYAEHKIPLSADQYWEHIHKPEFEDMVGEACDLDHYNPLEVVDQGEEIYRKIDVAPKLTPQFEKIVKKVAPKADPSYIEEQWRSKSEKVVRWKIHLSIFQDRCNFEGIVKIVPIDDHSCTRILDGDVKIKILGLGTMLEKTIVSQTVKAYGESAAVAGEYKKKYID